MQAGGRRFDPVQLHQLFYESPWSIRKSPGRLSWLCPTRSKQEERSRETNGERESIERFEFSVGLRDLWFVDN